VRFPPACGRGPSLLSFCLHAASLGKRRAVFLALQACLGLEIDAANKLVSVTKPHLPAWLDHVAVKGLSIAGGRASLLFRRSGTSIEVDMSEAKGGVRLDLVT
jgi:hypothetical protein